MELKYLKREEFKSWNNFVDSSPQGSIFSKSWYLDALQIDYDILVVEDKGDIKAGIVLAKNEINIYSNPIFDKYLGILFNQKNSNRYKYISNQYKIVEILSNELKKIKSFDYYFHPNFNNWIPLSWQGFTQQTRYTYRIDNSISFEDIEKKFHSNLKNDIKNALKNNVNIEYNIPLDELFSVVDKTFLRQGSRAPFSKERVKNFLEELINKDAFLSIGAYNQNRKPIAVLGVVYDKNSSYLILNGIDIDFDIRGANALIIKESIKYFHQKTLFYDFEGSMLKGVEPFYRKFGGELIPYYKIWSDNFFNFFKTKAKKIYKKFKYGR